MKASRPAADIKIITLTLRAFSKITFASLKVTILKVYSAGILFDIVGHSTLLKKLERDRNQNACEQKLD